jgi:prepilin-type N-terminal cleavage/methylation domain-containing protein
MSDYLEERNERGFTLVELLIAITVVGVLTAVAIVGLGSVTKTGNSSACSTLVESSKAAAATYYANTGAYPRTTGAAPVGFDALMTASPPVLSLPSDVNYAGDVMSARNSSWSVTMTGVGGITPNGYIKTGGGVACS